MPPPSRFAGDTAVTRRDDDVFVGDLRRAWWVQRGPNGGYLAAIILRALTERVGDAARAARSFTVHYAAAPGEGELVVATSVERTGRSLTSCSARVTQGERTVALAVAAFSAPRPGPEFADLVAPTVPLPEALPVWEPTPEAPPIARQWETRWAIGRPPWTDPVLADEAVAGGWIRLVEHEILDAPAIAAVTDAWVPAIFTRVGEPLVVPTIDLTVHFRSALPRPGASPDDFALVEFRTRVAADGFLEEDGVVWGEDGTLLAQSRQLAAILPAPS